VPSVEETLKKLAGALETACASGLDKVEVQRLQVVATLAKTYKEILSDYINYREIEAKLNDMEAKYAALLQQQAAGAASQSDSAQVAKNPAE
jgi:predicted ribosome quality control (RQC) complex YloA/Tae2 family protein